MTRQYQVRTLAVTAIAVLGATVALMGTQGVAPQQPATPAQAPPAVGTGAISGVVIDGSTNQSISGAIVTLGGSGRGVVPNPGRVSTDSQGRFVFSRLPAASFSLGAEKHGYANARYGQINSATPGQTIQLTDGQWFPDGRIVMWRPSAISGTVTDETGEPQVGVMVRVVSRVIIAGRPQLASATGARTDDRGRYRAAGLAPGPYVVLVPSVQAAVPSGVTLEELAGVTAENQKAAEAAGRPITTADPTALSIDAANRLIAGNYLTPPPASADGWTYPPIFAPNARSIGSATTVDLGRAEERTGIDVRLAPVRSVRVSGMLDGPATAIAGMTVRLLPAGNEALGNGAEAATALVSANGAFTLLRVPSGSYTIAVARSTMEFQNGSGSSFYSVPAPPGCNGGGSGFFSISNPPLSVRAAYRNCGGDATYSARMPLTVADRDMTGVVVALQRAVSISGRIVYADGPPAADSPLARIATQFFAEPATGDPLLGMPNGRTLPTDPLRFKIDGLLQGTYVLQVSGPVSGDVKSIEWQGRDYTDRPFDTTTGRDIDDVTITFTSAGVGRARGSVHDAKGATASTGLVIAFPTDKSMWLNYGLRASRLRSAQVTTTGTYTLSLRPGEYFLAAIDAGAAADWMDPRFLEAASAGATRMTLTWAETKATDLPIITVKVAR